MFITSMVFAFLALAFHLQLRDFIAFSFEEVNTLLEAVKSLE